MFLGKSEDDHEFLVDLSVHHEKSEIHGSQKTFIISSRSKFLVKLKFGID